MTAPVQPPLNAPQIDMERVVRRAAQNGGRGTADLAAELAMTQEVAELSTVRVAELEKQLEEKDAELARLRQSSDALRGQLADRDEAAEGGTAAAGDEVRAEPLTA